MGQPRAYLVTPQRGRLLLKRIRVILLHLTSMMREICVGKHKFENRVERGDTRLSGHGGRGVGGGQPDGCQDRRPKPAARLAVRGRRECAGTPHIQGLQAPLRTGFRHLLQGRGLSACSGSPLRSDMGPWGAQCSLRGGAAGRRLWGPGGAGGRALPAERKPTACCVKTVCM